MKPILTYPIRNIPLVLLALIFFIFFSCKQPGDEETPCFPFSGQVTNGIGGSPVAGATVILEGTAYPAATTDANGRFGFTDINRGVYDLLVTRPGMAGSRLSGIRFSGSSVRVEIVQPLYGFLPKATTPPSIVVSGIEAGSEYSGNVQIGIRALQGSCPVVGTEMHSSIYLKIGSTSMSYYEAANSDNDSLTYTWNTGLMPPGAANVKVVAYDNNNNRCEIDIPVIIASSTGKKPSVVPAENDYSVTATTYGDDMNIYRSATTLPSVERTVYPDTRSQSDTTIMVDFVVSKFYNGMAVFKSASEGGPYELCGQTTYTLSGDFLFRDYSPTLNPGTTVWYKLAYYNQYGIGPQTGGIGVWIQPRYHLYLQSPPNNSIVAEIAPTLRWSCEWLDPAGEPSGERINWIVVTNVIDASIVTYILEFDETEYALPALLRNNKYEWDVNSIYEYRYGRVISRSFPKGQGMYDKSMNGSFYFTIGMN